ncbi:hypothetical protein Vafri_5402 [Volvox africanus]|nr:hypothetical protein Vafri_5402 [Volvox africanus]
MAPSGLFAEALPMHAPVHIMDTRMAFLSGKLAHTHTHKSAVSHVLRISACRRHSSAPKKRMFGMGALEDLLPAIDEVDVNFDHELLNFMDLDEQQVRWDKVCLAWAAPTRLAILLASLFCWVFGFILGCSPRLLEVITSCFLINGTTQQF